MRTIGWTLLLALLAANAWLLTVLGLLSIGSDKIPAWVGFATAPLLFACGRMFMQLVLGPPSTWPRRI